MTDYVLLIVSVFLCATSIILVLTSRALNRSLARERALLERLGQYLEKDTP